jgi:uncharacterized membrane protein required for colicin V production
MTIWILALLLVLSLAALGYRQGAIRVACSLVGIIIAALLALPLAKPFEILLKSFGVVHPVVLWLVPPVIAFFVISWVVKGGAFAIHHKVEVYFKYKAGDLRLSLWERMNRRLGACLGVVNGVAYLVLISFVIYVMGYWTLQMETGTETRKMVKLLNALTRDLQSTGFVKSARAVESMPKNYYEAADVAGLLYQNPALEARLARYPGFLMLGEQPEFQALATDQEFNTRRARQDSLAELMAYGPVQNIVQNPDNLRKIWGIVEPDLTDLRQFLTDPNGISQKYKDETILGRWNISLRDMVAAFRRSKPNATAAQINQARAAINLLYSKVSVVVGVMGNEHQLVVKQAPNLKNLANPTPEFLSGQGKWDGASGNYEMTVNLGGTDYKGTAKVQEDRMTLTLERTPMFFTREF